MKKIIQTVAAGILLVGCTPQSVSAVKPEANSYTAEEIGTLVQEAFTNGTYVEMDLSAGEKIWKEGIQFADNGNSYIFWQENGITRMSAYVGNTLYVYLVFETIVFSEGVSGTEMLENSESLAQKIKLLKEWYLLQEGATKEDDLYRFMDDLRIDETSNTASVKIRVTDMPSNILGDDGITDAIEWIATYNGPDLVNTLFTNIEVSLSEEDGKFYDVAECEYDGMSTEIRIDRENRTVSSIIENPKESSSKRIQFSKTPGLDISSEECIVKEFEADDVLTLAGGHEEYLSDLLYDFLDRIAMKNKE